MCSSRRGLRDRIDHLLRLGDGLLPDHLDDVAGAQALLGCRGVRLHADDDGALRLRVELQFRARLIGKGRQREAELARLCRVLFGFGARLEGERRALAVARA